MLGVATVVLPNDELQRTSDGNAAASPLNSVFDGPHSGLVLYGSIRRAHEVQGRATAFRRRG